jgi:hypothetical protein
MEQRLKKIKETLFRSISYASIKQRRKVIKRNRQIIEPE